MKRFFKKAWQILEIPVIVWGFYVIVIAGLIVFSPFTLEKIRPIVLKPFRIEGRDRAELLISMAEKSLDQNNDSLAFWQLIEAVREVYLWPDSFPPKAEISAYRQEVIEELKKTAETEEAENEGRIFGISSFLPSSSTVPQERWGSKIVCYACLSKVIRNLPDGFPCLSFHLRILSTASKQESKNEFLDLSRSPLGFSFLMINDIPVIFDFLSDSLAKSTGLRFGDRIVWQEKKDNGVSLVVHRLSSNQSLKVKLVPINREWPLVTWKKLNSNIAYIRLREFEKEAVKEFEAAVSQALAQNADRFIIDFRWNPGGYGSVLVDIASYWLDKGDTVLLCRGRNDNQFNPWIVKQSKSSFLNGRQVIVLVNHRSCSASEALAGLLQDYNKALVVGESTAGKCYIYSEPLSLSSGSLKLYIVTDIWLTPHGRSVAKTGLIPDIRVKMTEDDILFGRDPQLEKAIQILSQEPKD